MLFTSPRLALRLAGSRFHPISTATWTPTRQFASAPMPLSRPRVLVVGGGYGGLSTVVNILNLSAGKPQLPSPVPLPELNAQPKQPPEITLLDERDGICRS